ncbi:hypothetical protein [Enterobacter asburiae]|uniref:hypothetical protein n=1 Tax=Enterobacter asburiae TaxID=61645 RepID=UPI001E61A892|nr:hypothetical protein [Enterobacter asburiae]MCE2003116.1 hypothetical protein [Enterobacter asburiae]
MKQRQFSADDINKKPYFMLQQNLEDMKNITCTLWRHDEGGGVHVDTFHTLRDASKEAQEIIRNSANFS